MTVRELITRLEFIAEETPHMTVVTDLHSEYAEVQSVTRISGFDNGGYVSAEYRAEDRTKIHGYLYIGVREDPS